MIKRFQTTNDEVYIEYVFILVFIFTRYIISRYAVELVETVGKIYEKRTESDDKLPRQPSQQKTSIQEASEKQVFKPNYLNIFLLLLGTYFGSGCIPFEST